MHMTGGSTVRSETVAGMRVSLCKDYESGGFYRFQITDEYGERHTTGLIDPVVADEAASESYDGFLDAAAEEFEVISLGDLFTE